MSGLPVRTFLLATIMFLFVALSHAANAQTYSFDSVEVEGNQRVETETILNYAGIARNESVGAGELNDAYQRILSSGLFETVEIEPLDDTLAIRVREFPTVNLVRIEGNRLVKDEDLLPLLRSQPRLIHTPAQAEADTAAIAQAYEQAGRLAATVNPKIIRRDDNRVDLIFEVSEGRVAEIERISFVGNRNFSERRLRGILETKQAGIFRALIARDTFIADRIEFDKQILSDFYLARGYPDFQVLSVNSELTRDRNAFFVTFNIREGQQFSFGEISVGTDVPDIDTDEFQEAIRIETGETYSPVALERTIARLERLAVQKDLDFIRVDPRVTRNDRDLTLDIEFTLVRGPRIFIERIEISGNATTLDRVIRRQFRVVEGDPFNPREIRAAAARIRALGFFSTAEVDTREGTGSDRVIVDVEVEEQPTGSLSFGVSYSANDGAGFAVEFSERNFLGRGQRINASINTTDASQSSSFGFTEPFMLGRDLSFGLNLEYTTTDADNGAFHESRSISFSPSVAFPVSENGRLTLRYRLASESVLDVSDDSSAILKAEEDQGKLYLSSVGYTYGFDNRRTGLNPDAGIAIRFGQDIAGIGGDSKYIRTLALAGAETRVLNDDVTLRAILEGGMLHMLSGNSRITDRFTLGSARLRGFERNGVGPRDLNAESEDALGGNLFAVARLEAEFPLGLPEEYGIGGGVFFDTGSVWGLNDVAGGPIDGPAADVDDDFRLRAVAGFSIFWDTPIGPLRFNFSNALKQESYDRERSFDLTVSTTF